MDITAKLLYIGIDLIMPLLVGYACRYQRRLDNRFFDNMININILVFYPLLSVLSFWVLRFTYDLIYLPMFTFIISIIPGTAAYWRAESKYSNPADRGSYIISAILSNLGTLGGLCAYIIFGETGFAYAQLVVLPQNIVIFMICYPLAQYYYQKSKSLGSRQIPWTSIFLNRNQIPVLGLLVGAVLYKSGLPRPEFLGALFDPLVHVAAWTALIPVGYAIDAKEVGRYYRSVVDMLPIKFVLTPLLTYLLAYFLMTDRTVIFTLMILASTPTAINAVITVKIHKLNLNIAMASFILTTAVFVAVVFPLLFFWITVS